MATETDTPRLYSDLASWWPMMSPPSQYVEEAGDLLPLLLEGPPARTLLELGSGGGSLAFHLKNHFTLTLTDLSPGMLAINKGLNPESEHICGDMMSLDLGRQFDRVLIHDAIMYATDPDAVRATLRTAARHCRAGGRIVVLPDCVRETFEPATEKGGEDSADGRGLRYLQWRWDPDPRDHTYERDFHRFGCFPRTDWLAWFDEAGFAARIYDDPWGRDVFIGVK